MLYGAQECKWAYVLYILWPMYSADVYNTNENPRAAGPLNFSFMQKSPNRRILKSRAQRAFRACGFLFFF